MALVGYLLCYQGVSISKFSGFLDQLKTRNNSYIEFPSTSANICCGIERIFNLLLNDDTSTPIGSKTGFDLKTGE